MTNIKTPAAPFRLDVPALMDRHNVSIRALAKRLGVSRHKARHIMACEWFSLNQHRALYRAIAGVQFDDGARGEPNNKYTEFELTAHDGEVKTYRAYPHHTRDAMVWALWQGKGKPVYTVSRPRRGVPRHVTCTCPDAARRNAPDGPGSLCKHATALVQMGMLL